MRIAFRTDASLHIGNGHVMRCLTLADKLVSLGMEVTFYTRPLEGGGDTFIRDRHKVVTLPIVESTFIENDYSTWLQVSQTQDASDFVEAILGKSTSESSVDIVVVDHYGIDIDWEKKVKNELDCKILVIDDLMRSHEADFLVDQTLGRSPTDYNDSDIATCLLGSEYALLRPEFNRYRNSIDNRVDIEVGLVLLISMGGGDIQGITLKVLKVLVENKGKTNLNKVEVVLNSRSSGFSEVELLSEMYPDWIVLHEYVSNMANLMIQSDLAVGAPGGTSWERCCLGIPSILIPVADNQKYVAKALFESKAIELIDVESIEKSLIESLWVLQKDYRIYQENCYNICDGLGAERVAQHINIKRDRSGEEIAVRVANSDDIKFVFDLQLVDDTRKYSRTKTPPLWIDHKKWMDERLANKDCYFYIIERARESIGVIRLDKIENNEFEISIFLCPAVYRLGIAKLAIQIILDVHLNICAKATVLEGNIASHNLFSSLGFYREDATTYKFERYLNGTVHNN